MSGYDLYAMPETRTWCGRFRCCREKNHAGACEIDITYLDDAEMEAIRKSGATPAPTEYRIERCGNLLVYIPVRPKK